MKYVVQLLERRDQVEDTRELTKLNRCLSCIYLYGWNIKQILNRAPITKLPNFNGAEYFVFDFW